jgi:predicted Zn-dependent protease
MLTKSPLSSRDSGLKQMLAQVALLQGRASDAVTLLSEARLLTPDDPSLAEDLATALLLADRPADAAELLARLLASPDYDTRTDIAHELARAHRAARNHSKAREAYLDAIARAGDEADPALWAGLGETAFLAGDLASVRRAASRLVTLRPNSADGYVLWALWHWREGDAPAARRSIQAGLAHAPRDPDLAMLIAMIDEPMDATERSEAVTSFTAQDTSQETD